MGMLVVVVLITAPLEVLVFELLVPWAWLRWVLLILGVYAVFWFLGFYASLVALPHRLEADGLWLRHGAFAEALVPYRNIGSVERRRRKTPKGGDGLQAAPEEDAAYLAINGNADLTLKLRNPLPVRGWFRSAGPVGTLHAAADEPEKMARQLRERLPRRDSPEEAESPLTARRSGPRG